MSAQSAAPPPPPVSPMNQSLPFSPGTTTTEVRVRVDFALSE